MPADNWERVFKDYLIRCALAVGAELKATDPDAEERGLLFFGLLTGGLYCPECWVRHGEANKLHQKRWLMSCDEHDYKVP
jgi:hypothetical protein